MSDQDLFFDEDEANGGPAAAPARTVAAATPPAGSPTDAAPAPGLHSVSLTSALLMTLAGLLAGVIVGMLIPAA